METTGTAKRIKWWAGVYEYHQREAPSEAVLKQYAQDISQYTHDEINAAWVLWRSKSGFPPKPGDLLPLTRRKLAIEDQAQLNAQNLFYVVSYYSKHGTCYPEAAEKWIREHIGDIGWRVVEQLGGWRKLWDRSDKLNPEMSIGAWRKMFDVLLLNEEIGSFCFPTKEESENILKLVDVKKLQAGDYDG